MTRRPWTVLGTGSYLPPRVVHNNDLMALFGLETDHEWIVQRTGIVQRHLAEKGETTSTMAVKASLAALDTASLRASDIDMIVLATTSPDDTFPSVASKVQHALGCRTIPAFDVQGVCSGFLYALVTADAWIQAGHVRTVLVIGAETMSSLVDWKDRRTAVLFGDGAGAMILRAAKNTPSGLLGSAMHCDGAYHDILKTDGGPSGTGTVGHIQMQGQDVFRHAVQKLGSACFEVLDQAHLSISEIDKIIPHQANARILASLQDRLSARDDQMVITVNQHANTSAASVPLALDSAWQNGKVTAGQTILMAAIGGGLTWGACVIRL